MMSGGPRARRWWLPLLLLLFLMCGVALAVVRLAPRPVDPHRLRAQAAAAVKAERYKEAEALLARLHLKRALDWVIQSKVDQALGRPEAALAALRHIPDTDRLAPLSRYSEGYIWFHILHRAPAAEAAFRRALELDPRSLQTRRELSYLYYILSMKAEFAAQFRVLEAMGQLTFDDVYHACVKVRAGTETRQIIEELKEFLAADPADRRSRLALAEELRRLDRVTEAEQVLAVLPRSDSLAQALRAKLALDRGEIPAAQAILATGPADDPDFAPVRGRLALARRDAKVAVREFQIAMATHSDHREVLFGLGRALRLAGDHRAAEPYLKGAADLDQLELLVQYLVVPGATRDAQLLSKLGAACEALHRYPEARAWFSLAFTYTPTSETRAALARLTRRNSDPGQGPGDRTPLTHDSPPTATDPSQGGDRTAQSLSSKSKVFEWASTVAFKSEV